MKLKHIVLLLFLAPFLSNAQQSDSLAFSKLKWEKKNLAAQTTLFSVHIADSSVFKSKQNINYVLLKPNKKSPELAFAYDKKTLLPTSTFAQHQGAIVAVNGTFFDMKNGGSVDYLKVNDTVINENRLSPNLKRTFHQKSAVTIQNGKVSIQKWDGTAAWEGNLQAQSVMTTGPLLILKGQNQKLDSITFNNNRHPRTAMGIRANGEVLLFTVDGRSNQSYGMSLIELTKVMQWLGCTDAINLDGGGSTTLWVSGFDDNGVYNYPSDNKKWDHQGERKVANIIFIKSKDKQ